MMPNKLLLTLVVGATLCAAQTVSAQSAKPAVAAKPTIAVGEPDPTAHRLPAHPPQESQVDAVFNAWDTDHNGSLSKQEFIAGSQQLRRESAVAQQLHAQFNALDADKSGSLDAHEYAQMALVKRAGTAAPSFSSFDANKNGRLDFAEYVKVVRQLAAKSAPATIAPATKP